MNPPPGLGSNMSTNLNTRGGGRRERSSSVAGQGGTSLKQQQQHDDSSSGGSHGMHTHNSDSGTAYHRSSQQSESDTKEHKSRKEGRERSRRSRRQAGGSTSTEQQQQQANVSGYKEDTNSSSDGSLKPTHRVIVDPNSFQRQILQSSPNLGRDGNSVGLSGVNERKFKHDDDAPTPRSNPDGSESMKSSRRQAAANRAVYSWQGTSSNQQQQQQQQQEQLEQHQQEQHYAQFQAKRQQPHELQQQHQLFQQQALRGSAGSFSQPGLRDTRTMVTGGPNNGPVSAGGRIAQGTPIVGVPPPMTEHCVKLMTDHGKIPEGVEQWFSEHPGHFVVGVLGGQGVGKSSLLSSFCPKPDSFPKQPPHMASVAGYQTSGIDMFITPERMVLLDTEPIFSMSSLEDALRNDRITDGVPVDMWLDHQALLVTSFLLSVCNVVVVMVDESNHWTGTTRVFKLLQRVELMMKALSLSNSGANATAGVVGGSGGANGAGGAGVPIAGPNLEGLGDWCADIVSNKVPVMRFGVEHYQRRAHELANLFQHSQLQMFASINMPSTYMRFEGAFNETMSNSASGLTAPSDSTSTMSLSDNQQHSMQASATPSSSKPRPTSTSSGVAEGVETSAKTDGSVPMIKNEKSTQTLNYIILPFDSSLASPSQYSHHGSTASTVPTFSPSVSHQTASTSLSRSNQLFESIPLRSPFAALNRATVFGSSHPDHDLFAKVIQDQERSKVWTRGLRNKILSLSMRPQGGPALGPRNRPGTVSEREWLRYAGRVWETIRKAEFLGEYIRAAKVSRDG
ncbi:smg-9, nonsense mediated mRNA decay factor [Podila epigama]|nr:smg-9, nonsense mediated mRNA decay factor [Podila epigama]